MNTDNRNSPLPPFSCQYTPQIPELLSKLIREEEEDYAGQFDFVHSAMVASLTPPSISKRTWGASSLS